MPRLKPGGGLEEEKSGRGNEVGVGGGGLHLGLDLLILPRGRANEVRRTFL